MNYSKFDEEKGSNYDKLWQNSAVVEQVDNTLQETFSSADLNSSADKDFLLGNVVVVTILLLLLLSELLLSLLSQPQNTTATHNANAKSDNIFFINIT